MLEPNDFVKNSLRSATTISLRRDILTFEESLDIFRRHANQLSSEQEQPRENTSGGDDCDGAGKKKKSLSKYIAVIKETQNMLSDLKKRVDDAEQGFSVLKFGLLTDLKREYINVPASISDKKRVALLPSEFGKVKRKRKNAATGAKKKKNKKPLPKQQTGNLVTEEELKERKKLAIATKKRKTTESGERKRVKMLPIKQENE